jgi:hypothetical protein
MNICTTSATVSFSRPFILSGVEGEQPAGSYTVETDEELLQTASVPAYRRISTLIRLPPRPGSTELERIVDLDPGELAAVLASDARAENKPPVFSSPASAETQGAKRASKQSLARGWKAGWHSWLALNANELTWTALLGGGVILAALFADR